LVASATTFSIPTTPSTTPLVSTGGVFIEGIEPMLGHGKIVDGRADPRSARAIARRREIVAENTAEVDRIAAALISDLGREPLASEAIAAREIAATTVRASRLRQRLRDDTRERRILASLLKASPFGMSPMPSVARASFPGPRQPGRRFYVAEKGEPFPPEPRAAAADANAPVNAAANRE
jgi:hypothetical protein